MKRHFLFLCRLVLFSCITLEAFAQYPCRTLAPDSLDELSNTAGNLSAHLTSEERPTLARETTIELESCEVSDLEERFPQSAVVIEQILQRIFSSNSDVFQGDLGHSRA